ncbi:hypothetical protein IBE10_09060 [Francisella tularensis subsp. novicida]|uniref:hypothetical protein n=1 Tax=Francisella tularensis TaxID=263 RepID=UPI0008FD2047|nr:hypothetical protein [Francisella tularensis]MBK2347065.1 hypothetical protein [Francisella tularensis subsp. novicida]
MEKLNFKRLSKRAAHYNRARAVYLGATITQNLKGTLYLNYNEASKNEELYNKLTNSQQDECKSFIREYNQERRLIQDFSNESFNAQSFYSDDVTIKILDKLHELGRAKPLNSIIIEAVRKELLSLVEKDNVAKDVCDRYNYDYKQLEAYKKHKNVFTVTFGKRKDIIELFLSLEDDKQNILNNLNDYLAMSFNTDKQLTLEQLYRMIDPQNDYFPKSYMLGAMLDIIDRYGVNPTDELDLDVVFFYWYQIRLLVLHESKAIQQFIKEFDLEESSFDLEAIQKPLVELMTKEVTDKYVGLGNIFQRG